ncbi:polysaccharide deacetylase family protein [Streptomyces sp. NPDC004135]
MTAPARHRTAVEGVPILMYHSVAPAPRRQVLGLSVAPEAFAEQMQMLHDARCTPVTTRGLADAWRHGAPLPARPVLITFDDGYESVHRHALPVLAHHSFPATVFVTTGWLRGPHEITGAAPDSMLDWAQVRELAALGYEIGGHSHSHPQLDQLSDPRLRFELERCRGLIGDELGAPPVSFAYPYGYSSRRVRAAVRETGHDQALAVGNAWATSHQSPYALRRVTVRRSTTSEGFGRLLEGRHLALDFAWDRALTKGYAVVRRSRRLAGKAVAIHA